MSDLNHRAARRLERLGRVLAGRQRRLAASIEKHALRVAARRPSGPLQRYGYRFALVAVVAVLPTALGFALKHRRVLARAATGGSDAQKWSRLLDDVRSVAGER